MDKGNAMNGRVRHIRASLALLLLTSMAAGCATTPPWAPVTPEVIPAQECGGSGDGDMDGITDCNDMCRDTPRGDSVDAEGCSLPMEPKPYRG